MSEHTTDDVPEHVPFAEFLVGINKGAAHADASAALAEVLAAVKATGKKGALVITLNVAPFKGSTDQVTIAASVVAKKPAADAKPALYFVTDDGRPSRDDPNQGVLPMVMFVDPKDTAPSGQKAGNR